MERIAILTEKLQKMSNHDRADTEVQDELTAYLDGELDATNVRRVEERLARDPDYRHELQRLERAWELLDRLPRAAVSDDFTKTTMEMVAVAAGQDAAELVHTLPRRTMARWVAAAGAVAAGLSGFLIGHLLWPDPNRKLLEDLPVLQNFESYYQADNIDFLRLLKEKRVFADGENDHAG
jgi:hypothetical protein